MKRQADKQLGKDDCADRDSHDDSSVVDSIASEKIMKERILKRAKLGGSAQIESESPHKLFSHGFLTEQTSASKDFSIKVASNIKPTSSMIEEHSQDSIGSQDNSTKHSQANSVCSDDVSIPDYPDDAFSRNISRLNTAVSKWIASQVIKNPICDLTPIFGDYQRYFKEFNREAHPSPSTSVSPSNNHTDTPYRPSQEITTVTAVIEATEKSVSTSHPLRGLLFSKPSTQVHSFSSPSVQSSKLSFSSTTSEPRSIRFNPISKPTLPSKFAASPIPLPISSKTFEAPQLKTGSVLDIMKPPISTSLNAKKDVLSGQEALSPISTISSALIPAPTNPSFRLSIPGVKHIPTSTTFKFNPLPLPIFPTAPSLSQLSASHSTSLSAVIHKPVPPEDENNEGEDDKTEPERPVTPPALKLDIENTVFTCNSKVFTKRLDSFTDLGICILRVRKNPDSNKTQLLVRNNTTIAKIIINTLINNKTPLSKPRDKEIMIICLKQETDLDLKLEGNQVLEMETFLIRVKTVDLATTLFSLLDEAKRKYTD
ncbi:Nuclear pore complex protein Nup50-like [Oopsacas minuta]|uniref:Nuclear pore complex protein Nup50-like n=1 Tax=Oopsacas minuta TaxID=111878 RepID=A0AAV7KI37_9METZ|nr:Nuclear pore complex protein Nup50-like [Oopsacas minuta]